MLERYYIHTINGPEGPYDMPTLFRKMRARKITMDTYLSDGDMQPRPAREVLSLASFAHMAGMEEPEPAAPVASAEQQWRNAMGAGWHYVSRNVSACAAAGVLALVSIMIALLPGMIGGTWLTWTVAMGLCMTGNAVLMPLIARSSRGQRLDPAFIRQRLRPALLTLLATGVLTALLSFSGLLLLLLPAVGIYAVFCFAPLLVLEREGGLYESMASSLLLSTRRGPEFFGAVLGVSAVHMLGVLLLLPLPLTLPLCAVALAELFDGAEGA